MNRKYVTPEISVVNMQSEDIIQTSGAAQPTVNVGNIEATVKLEAVAAGDIFN